jgi:hypothetical protein
MEEEEEEEKARNEPTRPPADTKLSMQGSALVGYLFMERAACLPQGGPACARASLTFGARSLGPRTRE